MQDVRLGGIDAHVTLYDPGSKKHRLLYNKTGSIRFMLHPIFIFVFICKRIYHRTLAQDLTLRAGFLNSPLVVSIYAIYP